MLHVGYFYYSEDLNWAAQNLRLGGRLDIAGVNDGWQSTCGGGVGLGIIFAPRFRFAIAVAKHSYC